MVKWTIKKKAKKDEDIISYSYQVMRNNKSVDSCFESVIVIKENGGYVWQDDDMNESSTFATREDCLDDFVKTKEEEIDAKLKFVGENKDFI